MNKKIIACVRLREYGEHVDDHQKEIVNVFKENGYILELTSLNNLDDLIKELKEFKPKKYESNTINFIVKLKKEIEM